MSPLSALSTLPSSPNASRSGPPTASGRAMGGFAQALGQARPGPGVEAARSAADAVDEAPERLDNEPTSVADRGKPGEGSGDAAALPPPKDKAPREAGAAPEPTVGTGSTGDATGPAQRADMARLAGKGADSAIEAVTTATLAADASPDPAAGASSSPYARSLAGLSTTAPAGSGRPTTPASTLPTFSTTGPGAAAPDSTSPSADAATLLSATAAAPAAAVPTRGFAEPALISGPAAVLPPAAGSIAPGTPLPAAPSPADAGLASPPGSTGFATELSNQVITFVRQGIEHARLHLNPAEMGPVEVRIQIEGEAARVVLAAEQATTRQWLEQALPALAGGLREAGLTLTGGGVFERGAEGGRQPEPGRSGGGDGRSERGNERGNDASTGAAALPPRRRGVVDLVA